MLGTKYLMDGPVYPAAFGRRGISAELPGAADRELVSGIIFDELVKGVFTDSAREEYVRVIERLAERGCVGVHGIPQRRNVSPFRSVPRLGT